MASALPANSPQEETDELESTAVDQTTAAMGGVSPKPVTGEEIAKFFANMMAPPAAAAPVAPAAPIPEKDYRGLKPIEIPNFDGDTSEYHFFKKSFKAAYDYRNLDKTTMALVLKSHLRGQASQYAQNELINEMAGTGKLITTISQRLVLPDDCVTVMAAVANSVVKRILDVVHVLHPEFPIFAFASKKHAEPCA